MNIQIYNNFPKWMSIFYGILLLALPLDVNSQGINLSGPYARYFPYIYIPFVSSTYVIEQGQKIENGECSFKSAVTLPAGSLKKNQRFVRVRRAVDNVECKQLIEQGVVNDVNPK